MHRLDAGIRFNVQSLQNSASFCLDHWSMTNSSKSRAGREILCVLKQYMSLYVYTVLKVDTIMQCGICMLNMFNMLNIMIILINDHDDHQSS